MEQKRIHDYIIECNGVEPLGQGSYGKVFPCYKINQENNQDYCVKIIQKGIDYDKYLKSEAQILQMQKLQQCENLVEVYDIYDEKDAIYIIMERCDYDLDKELKSLQQQQQWYTYDDILAIIQQIMNGSQFLFKNNIIHRDIKPQNILVKIIKKKTVLEQKLYKISDFGFAKFIENMQQQCEITRLGSPAYSAPQFFFDNTLSSAKCDVFSYGILFHQLIFEGAFPYDVKRKQLEQNIKNLQSKPFKCRKVNGKYGSQLQQLLERMIVYAEEHRISLQEIFDHPLMKIDICQKPVDSVFSRLKMDLSLQKQKEVNQERLREKQLDRLDRISKILNVFYRKYLLVKATSTQIQRIEGDNIDIKMINFVINQIGIHYLQSAIGMINGCISDIDKCFKLENDLPNLIEILNQCTALAPQFNNHRVERYMILQQYFTQKFETKQYVNQLNVYLINQSNQIPQQLQYFNLLEKSQVEKIDLQKLVVILEQMKASLPQYSEIQQNIDRISKLEVQYPIQRYQKIQLDEIFPQTEA